MHIVMMRHWSVVVTAGLQDGVCVCVHVSLSCVAHTTGSQPSIILAFRMSGLLLCGSSWASGRNWIWLRLTVCEREFVGMHVRSWTGTKVQREGHAVIILLTPTFNTSGGGFMRRSCNSVRGTTGAAPPQKCNYTFWLWRYHTRYPQLWLDYLLCLLHVFDVDRHYPQ